MALFESDDHLFSNNEERPIPPQLQTTPFQEALTRSFYRAPIELGHLIGHGLGFTNRPLNDFVPSFAQETSEDATHPYAQLLGSIVSPIPIAKPIGIAIKPVKSALKYAFEGFTPTKAAEHIWMKHDPKMAALNKEFTDISKEAPEYGPIKLDKDIFSKARKFGKKSDEYDLLVKGAEAGDYDALQNLQSSLYKRMKEFNKSGQIEKADLSPQIQKLRDRINEGIGLHFEKNAPELAAKRTAARSGYSDLKKEFNQDKVIDKLVGTDRKVPANFVEYLMNANSKELNAFRAKNPELVKKVQAEKLRRKILTGTGYALGAGGTLDLVSKLFK